jgi:hypothetical protein
VNLNSEIPGKKNAAGNPAAFFVHAPLTSRRTDAL